MFSVCEESPGVVSYFLTIISLLLVLVTLPFSLLYTVKVVQVRFAVAAPPKCWLAGPPYFSQRVKQSCIHFVSQRNSFCLLARDPSAARRS